MFNRASYTGDSASYPYNASSGSLPTGSSHQYQECNPQMATDSLLVPPGCDVSIPPPGAIYSTHLLASQLPGDNSQPMTSCDTFIAPSSSWGELSCYTPSTSYLDEIRRYEDWKQKFDYRSPGDGRDIVLPTHQIDRPGEIYCSAEGSTQSLLRGKRIVEGYMDKESRQSCSTSQHSRERDKRRSCSATRHSKVIDKSRTQSKFRHSKERDKRQSHSSTRHSRERDKRRSRSISPRSKERDNKHTRSSSRHSNYIGKERSRSTLLKSSERESVSSSSKIRSVNSRDRSNSNTRYRSNNRRSRDRSRTRRSTDRSRTRDTADRSSVYTKDRLRSHDSRGSSRSSVYKREISSSNYRKLETPCRETSSSKDRYRRDSSTSSRSSRSHSQLSRGETSRSSLFAESTKSERDKAQADKDKLKTSNKDIILEKFRKNFCRTSKEYIDKMEKIYNETDADDEDERKWYRSSPAELYYKNSETVVGLVEGTDKGISLSESFFEQLINRGRKDRPEVDELLPSRVHKARLCKHKLEKPDSSSDSDSNGFVSNDSKDEADRALGELQRKQNHPRRLHPEMWFNTAGEMNDGPACRCSARTKRTGIRHSVYEGEKAPPLCDPNSNDFNKLYNYRIVISPPTNFLIRNPTIITHDDHEFLFSGFSILSHYPLGELPECKVIRFNIEYTVTYIEEKTPLNFTIKELDLFQEYLFTEILELVDLNLGSATADGCSQFHFMPRFVRDLPEGGCEVLSMCEVLKYLVAQSGPLVLGNDLPRIHGLEQYAWQKIVDNIKGMIVTYPGKKPCSVRVDQLDRNPPDDYRKDKGEYYPEIVHFGIRPPEISYAGNPSYQKALRYYVKYRHLVANMTKPSWEDRRKLQEKAARLQDMRTHARMKRDVTVAVSSKGFHLTGLMCDIVQHAMLVPVLVCHLRFHNSLNHLEETLQYKFVNRRHLQLALTHPSYRENFGTNPDHARNSLTNCGIRQPKYGDRRIHYMNTRKRGINTLINIMSRFGKKKEMESAINHNERLEFLGDAVVEFLSSIHLFKIFPELEEGGLATYRAAIVQNQHLAVLAKKLQLDRYMLFAHGSDLCHDLDLRHAMANCFEALIGALFLDGGIEVADKVFALALWYDQPVQYKVWMRERSHLLQEQEPLGDRQYIKDFEFLQKLTKFEESINVYFKHIRLLARAFTDRSVGFTNLTLGSNQRLEFLGDTVLQLIVSDKLYRHFPEHHEGHLSLLRSSLVNNRTQSVVCDDLNMASYAVYHSPKAQPSTKGKADLMEAFLGALYIDKGIRYCTVFCDVVLFPRLQEFILNQDWNDPKSKLQQCCLTLRTMDGGEPDIPIYKVIECLGPTNTRVYTVAVYFRGNRLASASGHSIQEAEMNAAKNALASGKDLFPQLDHQKRVIAGRMKSTRRVRYRRGKVMRVNNESASRDAIAIGRKNAKLALYEQKRQEQANKNLPKAYRVRRDSSKSDSDRSDLSDQGKKSDASKKSARKRSSSSSSDDDSESCDEESQTEANEALRSQEKVPDVSLNVTSNTERSAWKESLNTLAQDMLSDNVNSKTSLAQVRKDKDNEPELESVIDESANVHSDPNINDAESVTIEKSVTTNTDKDSTNKEVKLENNDDVLIKNDNETATNDHKDKISTKSAARKGGHLDTVISDDDYFDNVSSEHETDLEDGEIVSESS